MDRVPKIGGEGLRAVAPAALEIVIAVGLATAVVALLQSSAPAVGLASIYLLAVLDVAVRRGQLPALITAVLSAFTLNYLFIPPRHELAIAHSQDAATLAVFLIVAVVVGRLAATGRRRAREAESRARVATAREREATLLADVASAILAGHDVRAQLDSISHGVADAVGASRARLVLEAAPSPGPDERVFLLRTRERKAWLYVSRDMTWDEDEVERICQPLGRLIDVAIEREIVADRAAETEAARRAEVARTAILHAISHDLRSPLTAITTAGSALRSAAITDEERDELLEAIDVEGARLARLVSDLLDLSRIQAGAAAPQADWCDLHDVVASAAAHLQTRHPLDFALPVELPLIRADAAQLERVFSNLIENAIKHSPPDEPVRISAGVGGGRVTVRVIDHGRGIPPQIRSRVFEPFFRGRGEKGAGSGLGLAISRGFVEANGGQIVLQSHRDSGTSFAVSFPLVGQPQPVA